MKILNLGSCNIDYVYSVKSIVREGETVKSNTMEVFPGGKGLNQSIALSRAGADVYHAGCIGSDGDMLKAVLCDSGVDISYLKNVDIKNGHAIIQVNERGENSIIIYAGSNGSVTKEYIDTVLEDFGEGDMLLLQNEVSNVGYAVNRAYEKGMCIMLNPSPINDRIYEIDFSKLSYLILNETEAKEITDAFVSNESVDCLSRQIRVHNMKLHSTPFEMIKSGKKTIELRLLDEKRQQVKAGDKIVFTNIATGETLNMTVSKLHRFNSFEELYKSLPLIKCGYTTEDVCKAHPSDMERYYSAEEQKKYGVVGIELCQPKQITDALQVLEKMYPNLKIMLTLGSKGCVYYGDGELVSHPVFEVKAVDTTAAGDTFTGYFAQGISRGMPIETVLERASAAAAIAVSRKGAAPSIPIEDEVNSYIERVKR